MRVRTKDCYKCYKPKEVLYRCRFQELEIGYFFVGSVCKESKRNMKILINMVELGRVRRNRRLKKVYFHDTSK